MIAARADVEDRIELARKLLCFTLGRSPTSREIRTYLSDADVNSLSDDATEELPRRTVHARGGAPTRRPWGG